MSNEKKRGVWFGSELQRLVDERADRVGGMRSASGVINAVADRYLQIVRRSTPTLSVPEWSLIFHALNGVWAQDSASLYVGALMHGVADHINLNGAAATWCVDGDVLLSKLSTCSFCQLVAIVDSAERFWATAENPADQDMSAQITAIVGAAAITS